MHGLFYIGGPLYLLVFFLGLLGTALGEPSMSLELYLKESGGRLKGTVRMAGIPQPPRRYNLVLNPDPYYCGRISDGKGWRLSPVGNINSHGHIGQAIVYLQGVKSDSMHPPDSRLMTIKNCVYFPYVDGLSQGDTLRIENWDPVQHHVEIFLASDEGGVQLFDAEMKPHPENRKSDYLLEGAIGTPRPGPEQVFKIDQAGILYFRCHYHKYMEGWRAVISHPYYSVTRESGTFEISGIPPGSYNLKVWHPMGTFEQPIRINSKEELDLNIRLPPAAIPLAQEDLAKPNPFGIDLVGDEHIVPTVELQNWDPGLFTSP